MGRPSVTHQVNVVLNEVFDPGKSRHKLKASGQAKENITSISTMITYVDANVRFAKWCKSRYGIRYLSGITPDMAKLYITELHDRELSGGYIGKIKSAVRKLDVAMRKKRWYQPDAPPLLEPGGGWHSDRHPERAYTLQQADCIVRYMREHTRDKQTANVVWLQRVAGLRITEAVMLRGQDIDLNTCTVYAVKSTKGGRPRKVNVDPKHQVFLERLKDQSENHRDSHVFQGRGHRGQSLVKRTRSAVRYACERLDIEHYSTHGFRRTWAQEQHQELLEQGLNDRESRQSVAEGLGHGRVDVTYSYIPR